MITAGVPMDRYVADDFAGGPSLNASLAHLLLTKSPQHARAAHPRLNPPWRPDDSAKFDLGKAAHAGLLEAQEPDQWEILPFDDYRSKAAQGARADAITLGKLPLLAWQAEDIAPMIVNARRKLEECPDLDDIVMTMDAEQTILWAHEGTALRCRPDWLTADRRLIVSYKTTGAGAHPDEFVRTLLNQGYDLQGAFELAAVKAETGIDAHYLWLVGETDPPYAVSLIGMDPAMYEVTREKMKKAVRLWSACLTTGTWPAYPEHICYPVLPPWEQAKWLEQEAR